MAKSQKMCLEEIINWRKISLDHSISDDWCVVNIIQLWLKAYFREKKKNDKKRNDNESRRNINDNI